MREWAIYPAIDLRRGRVVRLVQGDPQRETAYADGPLATARRWRRAGATWLHVVNLDGAFGESGQENLRALQQVLTLGVSVQFGGGLRDLRAIELALALGVSRVVLGTAAVEDPPMVRSALEQFGAERVAVGLDAVAGRVRTRGWTQASALVAIDVARQWANEGLRWLVFTDVSRDGMGTSVNVEESLRLAQATGLQVIASGGVAGLEDVQRAYDAGLRGLIIGRALYEGGVDLAQALAVGRKKEELDAS